MIDLCWTDLMICDLPLHVSDVLACLLQHLGPAGLVPFQSGYAILQAFKAVLDGVSPFSLHCVVQSSLVVILTAK